MAASTPLRIFPSPATTLPRKSSLKRPQAASTFPTPIELRGLALQITTPTASPQRVLPAADHIKHSLFCEPSLPKRSGSNPSLQRRPRTSRRSSTIISVCEGSDALRPYQEDLLSPLPTNTYFGASSPLKRQSATQLERPELPHNISTEAQPDSELPFYNDDDRLSPLPDKTRFIPASPQAPEYPAPLSQRSGSATLLRSNSVAGSKPSPSKTPKAPIRSMFPRYDHSKPLEHQDYYPSSLTPVCASPTDKISKDASPLEKRRSLMRSEPAVGLHDHVPVANRNDLLTVWDASSRASTIVGRKVQLGLYRAEGANDALAIGPSADQPLYSIESVGPHSPLPNAKRLKHLSVEKHSPHGEPPEPVTHLTLPDLTAAESDSKPSAIAIFPQTAAMHAIQAVATSPAAAEIATFDPTASSPEAARLARDAVENAHRQYGCNLFRMKQRSEGIIAATAAYTLDHPELGSLPITVTRSMQQGFSRLPALKICLHRSSATPAAITAGSLVLASLDFARDACVLDIPGLLALNHPYIIDTTISALLVVAAIETTRLSSSAMAFPPPPLSPYVDKKSRKQAQKSTGSRKWYKRSSKAIDKVQKELVGQPADVAAPVQIAVALVGLTLKTAIFVLEAGVKAAARVVVGVGHMASK